MFVLYKRRVNIAKVNSFVADKPAQNVEVVAVKEFVHRIPHYLCATMARAIKPIPPASRTSIMTVLKRLVGWK